MDLEDLRTGRTSLLRNAISVAGRELADDPEGLGPELLRLLSHPDAGIATAARRAVTATMTARVSKRPEAAAAVARVFLDSADTPPDLRRELALSLAEGGNLTYLPEFAGTESPLRLAWLRDDAKALHAEVAAVPPGGRPAAAAALFGLCRWYRLTPGRRDPQQAADAVLPLVADPDPEVRAITAALLAECATAGADLSAHVPALESVLPDVSRVPQPAGVPSWWQGATVTWLAARALGAGARHTACRSAAVGALVRGIASRRKPVRLAAAHGLGAACTGPGDAGVVRAVAVTGNAELIGTALWAVSEVGGPLTEATQAVVDAGTDPATLFPGLPVGYWSRMRVLTRGGLGVLLDGLASVERGAALRAILGAVRAGDPLTAALPLVVGTLWCGDWRVHREDVAELLRAVDPAAVAPLRRWLDPGGPVLGVAGSYPLPFPEEPWPAPPKRRTATEVGALLAAKPSRAPLVLRELVRPLYLTGDPQVRCDVLRLLVALAVDMVDLRAAQPAVAVALFDPEPSVRELAVGVVRERSWQGADVRLAFPALGLLAEAADPGVRGAVWETFQVSDSRHDAALGRLADVAARVAGDPDPEIRRCAENVLRRGAAAPTA